MIVKPKNYEELIQPSERLTQMLCPTNQWYTALKKRLGNLGRKDITRTAMWQWLQDYHPETGGIYSWEGNHFFVTPPVLDAFSSDDVLYAGKGLVVPRDKQKTRLATSTDYFWQTFFNQTNFLDYDIRMIPKKIVAGKEMRTHPSSGATSIQVLQRLEEIAFLWDIPIEKV